MGIEQHQLDLTKPCTKSVNSSTNPRLTGLAIVLSSCALVACGGSNNSSDPQDQEGALTLQKLVPTQSPEVLENYLKEGYRQQTAQPSQRSNPEVDFADDVAAVENAPEADGGASDFTSTNLQEQGVDEADKVKYDGEYIFAANETNYYWGWPIDIAMPAVEPAIFEGEVATFAESDEVVAPLYESKIRVLRTNQENSTAEEVTEIVLSTQGVQISGMYHYAVDSDTSASESKNLAVLSSGYPVHTRISEDYWSWTEGRTSLHVINVDDPANSEEIYKLQLQGTLVSSRKVEDTLYVVSRYTPRPDNIFLESGEVKESSLSDVSLDELLPKSVTGDDSPDLLASADNCFVPETNSDYYYPTLINITAIDLSNLEGKPVSICVAGYSHNIYASTEAIYLVYQDYQQTLIHKFGYTDSGPAYISTGVVKGDLGWQNAPFRFSEKEGYLRVISSVRDFDAPWTDQVDHRLTILKDGANNEMEVVSQLPNSEQPAPIGKPNEQIFAVRYFANRAYVVTFQRTDPLYVIDLTPESPSIQGELELPGFSEYLHPIGEELLLGVGKDARDNGRQEGVKVVLFDVSDATNPTTEKEIKIGKAGSNTAVAWDHKAFTFLNMGDDEYRMSVPVTVYGDNYNWLHDGLYLFNLTDKDHNSGATLTDAGAMIAVEPTGNYNYSSGSNQRSIIHDDSVHFIYNTDVYSANWNTPDQVNGPQ